MPTRQTIKEILEETGLTRHQFDWGRKQGFDMFTAEGRAEYASNKRHRIKADAELSSFLEDESTIIGKLNKATKIEDVKLLKEKAHGMKLALEADATAGKLIPLREAKEGVVRIVSELKSRLLKMPSDLAPRAEGLEAAKVEKVIKEELYLKLEEFADSAKNLFADSGDVR